MAKEILINVEPQETRVAVVDDGKLEEFYIERPQDKTIVGNIYKGRIEAVLPSINGAFVDIGLPKKGFLYLSEIESVFEAVETKQVSAKEVKKGQEVLVQVVKESFGTKGPRLSCHIGIAGRYLVLMPQDTQIGVSRRIEDDAERKRLKGVFAELKLPRDTGFIIRTVAQGKSKQELLRDANFLLKLWARLEKPIRTAKAPALIYEEYDLTFRAIRDSFTEDVSRLIIDSKEEFYRILRFMRSFMSYLCNKVELYRGNDLFEDKNIERQADRIFESKVYMKSKAYLVIEPTEGLVVIDVNSGGFRKKVGQEETAFKVNCEAAIECAHQICLRDLGGIIVIDFIDMESERHRREVLNILKRELNNDKAKYDIAGISRFGVIELTRERIHKTASMVAYQNCPYCSGRGKVKTPLTVSITALKELERFLIKKPSGLAQANLTLNPTVIDEIMKNRQDLKALEHKFKVRINLVSNPALHIEEVKVA